MADQRPFPAARAYYRALKLRRHGLPLALGGQLARLGIWPDTAAYDAATGWLRVAEFGVELRADGRTLLARAGGLTFVVEAIEDLYTLRDVLVERIYADFARLNIAPDSCVWDVGMNLGAASLFFADYPEVQSVYGYEPFAHTFALAQQSLRLNGGRSAKIKAHHAGISDSDRSIVVRYTAEWKASARTDPVSDTDTPGRPSESVRLLDADAVLKTIRDENPQRGIIAKIDCEGAEYAIIRRLAETGRLRELRAAEVECHEGSEEIERAFRALGFATETRPTATAGFDIVTARQP